MSVSPPEPITILVVDDDEGHCELVRRNLRRAALQNPVVVVHSGEAALDYVYRRGRHGGRAATGSLLVLLDINMPGAINGLDVLHQLKGEVSTRNLPVIMLTTTDDPREIDRCYQLGCNVYVTKPVDPSRFVEAIRRLGRFIEIVSVVPLESEAT
jgi:CheY-like chemotaxis protein